MNRRSFLFGASASLIAAPAIVRAASLMPIRGIVMPVTAPEVTLAYGRLTIDPDFLAKWRERVIQNFCRSNGALHSLLAEVEAR